MIVYKIQQITKQKISATKTPKLENVTKIVNTQKNDGGKLHKTSRKVQNYSRSNNFEEKNNQKLNPKNEEQKVTKKTDSLANKEIVNSVKKEKEVNKDLLENKNQKLEDENKKIEQTIGELNKATEQKDEKIKKLKTQLEEIKTEDEKLETQTKRIQTELNNKTSIYLEVNKKSQELEHQVKVLSEEIKSKNRINYLLITTIVLLSLCMIAVFLLRDKKNDKPESIDDKPKITTSIFVVEQENEMKNDQEQKEQES